MIAAPSYITYHCTFLANVKALHTFVTELCNFEQVAVIMIEWCRIHCWQVNLCLSHASASFVSPVQSGLNSRLNGNK
jgi:hypothetical protein